MTAFLRKYWLGLSFFVLWCLLVVFFEPWQERFYLDADIEPFKKTSHLALIVLEACFAVVIVLLALRGNRNRILRVLLVLGVGGFFFLCFFSFDVYCNWVVYQQADCAK